MDDASQRPRDGLPGPRQRTLEQLRERLLGEPGIAAAYLHGSFADASVEQPQDIDVAVLLSGSPSSKEALDRELALEQTIAASFDGAVDVRVLNHASLRFRGAVLRGGIRLVSNDEDARCSFEEGVLALYPGLERYLMMYNEEVLGAGT